MSSDLKKVLLVDDDPVIRRILSTILTAAGYETLEAPDGRAALAMLETDCPHFLVSDWEMPVMNGIELCRQMRAKKLPNYVYTLLVTSRNSSDDMVLGLEAGADDFLRKPVDKAELLARLIAGRRVLDLESRLVHLANSDALTGLPTKRVLNDHLEREWFRARRYHADLACVMLDIDFFKRVNDAYGHPAGDQVLRVVARQLSESCRACDIVGRYGGEEFCAILTDTSAAEAQIWAERLRQRISRTPIEIDGATLQVTASFGVADVQPDTASPADLIDTADQCLLSAKQSGRDRVVCSETIRQLARLYRDPNSDYGAQLRGIQAHHVMTAIVASLRDDATIGAAAEHFLRFRISSSPVINANGQLVGFVSEKDLMNVLFWPDSWERPIRDVMRTNVVCYPDTTPALAIYEFLCRVSIRSIVVTRDGLPIGVVHRGSLLRWFHNTLARTRRPDSLRPSLSATSAAVLREGRLRETVETLDGEIDLLQGVITAPDSVDLVPWIVGSASRIQELATDLLAHTRFAGDAAGAMSAMESLVNAPAPAANPIPEAFVAP